MSDTFTISGRIVRVGETQTVGTNGFRKRGFILDTEKEGAKYPNEIAFELHKDQCDIHVGMGPATVRFAINGRAWKDRHFNTLKAFSVASSTDLNDAATTAYKGIDFKARMADPSDSKPMPPPAQPQGDDDLPF